MRRFVAVIAIAGMLTAGGIASAKLVGLTAVPNPVPVGDRVRHDVSVDVGARLDVWVSGSGFQQPGFGTLPPGTWERECCPVQTAGTVAWHFRSFSLAPPGTYRFGAVARARGTFLSTATSAGTTASVWVRVR